jgi:TonB family protein
VQEQKMIEQTPIEQEEKPEEPKDEPPPVDLGTNLKGDGPPDGFGMRGSGNGNLLGDRKGAGSGQRSRWGWYAGQVQSRIADALRCNDRTRRVSLNVQVRVWPDATGRITRAQLAGSTGDAGLDAALKNEVLQGLQLQEPPPQGMPLPIVLRLTARRPN